MQELSLKFNAFPRYQNPSTVSTSSFVFSTGISLLIILRLLQTKPYAYADVTFPLNAGVLNQGYVYPLRV